MASIPSSWSSLHPFEQEKLFVETNGEHEITDHIREYFNDVRSKTIRMAMSLALARRKFGARSAQWSYIREQSGFSKSMVSKLVAIGSDSRIWQPGIFEHMPDHWGTLYFITRLDDEQLRQGIAEGVITYQATRQEVSTYVRDVKGGLNRGPSNIFAPVSLESLFYEGQKFADATAGDEAKQRMYQDETGRQRTWAEQVLWYNTEIKRATRGLFNVRVDYNRISYEDAKRAIELSNQLASIPHVYPVEVNERSVQRLEDRALDRFISDMDYLAEMMASQAADPLKAIEALSDERRKLLNHLDKSHPVIAIIYEEFSKNVLGQDVPTRWRESFRRKMRRLSPFEKSNHARVYEWAVAAGVQPEMAWEYDWEIDADEPESGLTTDDIIDSRLFQSGDGVEHPEFGRGVVLENELFGGVRVVFESERDPKSVRRNNLTLLDIDDEPVASPMPSSPSNLAPSDDEVTEELELFRRLAEEESDDNDE